MAAPGVWRGQPAGDEPAAAARADFELRAELHHLGSLDAALSRPSPVRYVKARQTRAMSSKQELLQGLLQRNSLGYTLDQETCIRRPGCAHRGGGLALPADQRAVAAAERRRDLPAEPSHGAVGCRGRVACAPCSRWIGRLAAGAMLFIPVQPGYEAMSLSSATQLAGMPSAEQAHFEQDE